MALRQYLVHKLSAGHQRQLTLRVGREVATDRAILAIYCPKHDHRVAAVAHSTRDMITTLREYADLLERQAAEV
jgi:hypothetical protein